MKSKRLDKFVRVSIYVCVFLLGYFIISAAASLLHGKPGSLFSSAEGIDAYEIRSRLLMEATDHVGVAEPMDAARVWADGLKGRSAAMQYAVMTKSLKERYAKQLENTFTNWVTGGSSPWIQTYAITERKIADGYIYSIQFYLMSSAGPEGEYGAMLTVAPEDGFWRISEIKEDKGLSAYTGFLP